jgi:hypothetical protein
MRIAPSATILASLLTVLLPVRASAQVTTKTEGLSLNDTLVQLLKPISPAPVGEAVAFATAIEIATTPFGTTSGGFVFKLDPTTGLRVQSASTFGPSFAERALTTGAGKMNVAANLTIATYDKLGDFALSGMQLSSIKGASNAVTRTGNASLVLSSQTLVITGTAGVTDDFDIGVAIPLVKVKVDGLSWVQRADGVVALRATGSGIASGLGDIAATAKYRFLKFGQDQPDPGGLAASLVYHMPTGNRANLRGLGMTRALGSIIYSSGRGKLRPHGNVGFEWWEKGLTVQSSVSGVTPYTTVEARHMLQYAAGAEFEASPKFTLLVDFLGRHYLGGGRIDTQSYKMPPGTAAGVDTFEAAGVTDSGIRKMALVPGLKWNVKGTFLLALNARIPVGDNSLYDKFTPVLGVEWTF